MRDTFRILFYIKKQSVRHDGKCPILCRITVMGQIANMSTHLYVEPKNWSISNHKTLGTTPLQRAVNDRIERIVAMLEKIYFDRRFTNEEISARLIKDTYLKHEYVPQTVLNAMKCYNDLFARDVGRAKSASTYKKHQCVYNHMQKFLMLFYVRNDMNLKDITPKFIKDFECYLRQHHCSTNTVCVYMLPVKHILTKAYKRGEINSDPFADYKFKHEHRQRGYLTHDELEAMLNMKTDSARENHIRNLFVFSCFTGLSYSDICLLTYDNLTPSFDNHLWIRIPRKKTGTIMNIRLLDIPIYIINRYGNGHGRIFNVPSNKTCNRTLEAISNKLGYKLKVTFHVARHKRKSYRLLINKLRMCYFSIGNDLETNLVLRYA